MSERSPWSEPTPSKPLTHKEAYAPGLAEDADIDKMVMLGGDVAPQMIEVPDWSSVPENGEEVVEKPNLDPLAIGREITVLRNGKDGAPDYEDSGWKIVNNTSEVHSRTDGQLKAAVIVEKTIDGTVYKKRVASEKVLELNPEKNEVYVPLNLAERLGGTALDATGIGEVADINEDARKFTHSELKALREQAAQRTAAESQPVIPNLAEIMSEKTTAGAVEGIDALHALTEGMSDDDRMELRAYAEAKIAKREAQQRGQGEASTAEGQRMGQAYRAMSSKAKSIADTYARVYEHA